MAVFSPAFASTKAEKAFGFHANRVCLTKRKAFGRKTLKGTDELI